ncbi:MAG: M56 family metallopeptidase [Verrucomicrobiales bacterium]|nr:M56 family metallopeptidase [Verrucomicrobiales bacterium]
MKIAPLLLEFPILVTLGKWTVVLGLAMAADVRLRRHPPQIRQWLWRGVLLGSLLLAVTHVLPVPVLRLAILESAPSGHVLRREAASPPDPDSSLSAASERPKTTAPSSPPPSSPATSTDIQAATETTASARLNWPLWLTLVWAVGFLICAGRLALGHLRLARWIRIGQPATHPLSLLTHELSRSHAGQSPPEVIVSSGTGSPFACGLIHRRVVLPDELIQRLDSHDLRVLLGHELAHLRRQDPLWCAAWSWVAALAWFHPLAWWAARSHVLACELEADRACAESTNSWPAYRSALSRIALDVLRTQRPEFSAALHASSHLGHRLDSLDRGRPTPWTASQLTVAGAALTAIVMVAAGCHFTPKSTTPTPREFRTVAVRVLDEHGLPVAGAKVRPFGLRVRGDEASAYGWDPAQYGPRDPVITKDDGVARVQYPVVAMPEERFATIQLLLTVDHPDFSRSVNQGYAVDGTADPIRLRRGGQLRVAGYHGSPDQTVRAILPLLSAECVSCNDWTTNTDGSRSIAGLVPGPHLLRLSGKLASGEIVHSDPMEIHLVAGEELRLNLELKPGARLEGRLDARVPRPVRNGRVLVASRPPQIPALVVPEDLGVLGEKYGEIARWQAWRPIAEDGTFLFESLPFGEADIIALGDGFVSAPGGVPQNRDFRGGLIATKPIGVPQSFAVNEPVTRMEVVTEPSARFELSLRTRSGEPVENAVIQIFPNVLRFPNGIFGEMSHPSEAAFGPAEPLSNPDFAQRTDRDGRVVFQNLPSCARGLDVIHPNMVIPLSPEYRDRWVRFTLTPGNTTRMDLTLIPKGVDFAGAK